MATLSIGQVARRAEVRVDTVRFYERTGLLEAPPRRASGYRQYPESIVARIRFIKQMQRLGFSLNEIREVGRLRVDAHTTCREIQQRTATKIAEVEHTMAELHRLRDALLQVVVRCTDTRLPQRCPLLVELDLGELAHSCGEAIPSPNLC